MRLSANCRQALLLSKKWLCHFFKKDPLRSAPQLFDDSGQLRRRTQREALLTSWIQPHLTIEDGAVFNLYNRDFYA